MTSEGNYTCPHCGQHFNIQLLWAVHVAGCTFRPKKED